MKQIYSLLSVLALTAGITSCTKDGYSEYKNTYPASAISIITNETTGEVNVMQGVYGFSVKITDTENLAYVISPSNMIADNTSLSFTTDEKAYKSSGNDIYLENVSGTVNNSTLQLHNANFLALNPILEGTFKYGYYYDTTNIGEYTYKLDNMAPWITLARYYIGNNYRVNTFPETTFFKGTSTTYYPAHPEGFVNEDILYRFSISQDTETKEFSATMILYNAKFAAEMPITLAAVVVEGLDVDFTADGVVISGENIIPTYYKEAGYDPLPMYIFKSVEFKTTNNDYTQGVLDYHVGENYVGHFEGSYANTYYHP